MSGRTTTVTTRRFLLSHHHHHRLKFGPFLTSPPSRSSSHEGSFLVGAASRLRGGPESGCHDVTGRLFCHSSQQQQRTATTTTTTTTESISRNFNKTNVARFEVRKSKGDGNDSNGDQKSKQQHQRHLVPPPRKSKGEATDNKSNDARLHRTSNPPDHTRRLIVKRNGGGGGGGFDLNNNQHPHSSSRATTTASQKKMTMKQLQQQQRQGGGRHIQDTLGQTILTTYQSRERTTTPPPSSSHSLSNFSSHLFHRDRVTSTVGGGGGGGRGSSGRERFPIINASALLNAKDYCVQSANAATSKSGTEAALRLVRGRRDFIDTLRQEVLGTFSPKPSTARATSKPPTPPPPTTPPSSAQSVAKSQRDTSVQPEPKGDQPADENDGSNDNAAASSKRRRRRPMNHHSHGRNHHLVFRPPQPYVLQGHGVPVQLLQAHVDFADQLLTIYNDAAECSFSSTKTNHRDDPAATRTTASDDDSSIVAVDWMRARSRAGDKSYSRWPINEELNTSMQLYLTVMLRLATHLGVVLQPTSVDGEGREGKNPEALVDHKNEAGLWFSSSSSSSSLDTTSQTKPPRHWNAEFLRGMHYAPDLLPNAMLKMTTVDSEKGRGSRSHSSSSTRLEGWSMPSSSPSPLPHDGSSSSGRQGHSSFRPWMRGQQHGVIPPLAPIVEWTPLDGMSAPGHVCVRLQGFPSRQQQQDASRDSDNVSPFKMGQTPTQQVVQPPPAPRRSVTLCFDACFRNQ